MSTDHYNIFISTNILQQGQREDYRRAVGPGRYGADPEASQSASAVTGPSSRQRPRVVYYITCAANANRPAEQVDASSTAEMDKKGYGMQRGHLEQPQKKIRISNDEIGDQPPPRTII
ncbi:hypothetical protein QTP88_017774 [Uroleucon formosanum]